jgi:membrane-bound lytic murein transglycosylase A
MADAAPLGPKRDPEHSVLESISFADIPGWGDDDHAAAHRAFLSGARLIAESAPKTRALGTDGAALQSIARAAMAKGELDPREAREFFERWFIPHRIAASGFVTGYYEPEVEASRERSGRFNVPLYRRPSDLIEVKDAERPPDWDPDVRFARRSGNGPEPFFDRPAIEDGALVGRGLELAFVADAVDAFFIHVQGSARLRLIDGSDLGKTLRIGFDGKSGHAYTSIGRLAVERGILSRERADKDGLMRWLKSHPQEGRNLMRENRSYIFFRETAVAQDEGPLGAAGVPLTPFRSLAVDRTLHTFHAPVFVDAEDLADPQAPSRAFRRLMIAQDTGSAIVGPARGDIFFGSGDEAGSRAGRVRHIARMFLLMPLSGMRG